MSFKTYMKTRSDAKKEYTTPKFDYKSVLELVKKGKTYIQFKCKKSRNKLDSKTITDTGAVTKNGIELTNSFGDKMTVPFDIIVMADHIK